MGQDKRCAVPGCNSKNARFHFPKYKKQNVKWLQNTEIIFFCPHDVICINHFSNDQYYNPKLSILSLKFLQHVSPHPEHNRVKRGLERLRV